MSPGMVWLQLVPCVGIVWEFFVVIHVADSLEKEFTMRGLPIEPKPGRGVGLAMCILNVVGVIPYLGLLAAIPALICWILYWVKIAGYSKQIATPAS